MCERVKIWANILNKSVIPKVGSKTTLSDLHKFVSQTCGSDIDVLDLALWRTLLVRMLVQILALLHIKL